MTKLEHALSVMEGIAEECDTEDKMEDIKNAGERAEKKGSSVVRKPTWFKRRDTKSTPRKRKTNRRGSKSKT